MHDQSDLGSMPTQHSRGCRPRTAAINIENQAPCMCAHAHSGKCIFELIGAIHVVTVIRQHEIFHGTPASGHAMAAMVSHVHIMHGARMIYICVHAP